MPSQFWKKIISYFTLLQAALDSQLEVNMDFKWKMGFCRYSIRFSVYFWIERPQTNDLHCLIFTSKVSVFVLLRQCVMQCKCVIHHTVFIEPCLWETERLSPPLPACHETPLILMRCFVCIFSSLSNLIHDFIVTFHILVSLITFVCRMHVDDLGCRIKKR